MAPPQGQPHPGRQIAVLGALFVILYALVFFAGAKGGLSERLEPKLGLDLVGGTRVTYEARTETGAPPSGTNLEQARRIIESRVNGLGVTEAEVVTEGDTNIVVSLAGESNDQLKQVGVPAQLRFRKVINNADGNPVPDAQPAPSASATPSPGATPSAAATPSTAPTPTAAPTPAATAPAPTPSATIAPPPERADVQAKVGPAAWSAADGLTAPANLAQDPSLAEILKPFQDLTGEEVAVLPVPMQFNVPYVDCTKLDDRPAGSIVKETEQAVACESGTTKYLLDVGKVLGTDVTNSDAVIDPQTGQWTVNLEFNGAGQERWTKLTQEAVSNTAQPTCTTLGNEQHCLVAVVLDNEVVSAPEIKDVIPGDATISGSFDRTSSNLLASQLRYGALPLTFEQTQSQTVSATLGAQQLRAGLLAAGIGMLLVIIYAFFYYRLLGTVIFLSLVLSGLLVFGTLVLLGRQIGFTLTLAGIAGFIVSLGVAADSFVIYFERLKDEIRDGRSPRSAVPRAWARARRTIISANAITLLAAVVLYLVSVGTVKGFAFALGLATVLDLVVVFLFRHPIMTMFANTKAFMSPRVSGLGRVLQHAGTDEPRTTRVKEA